MRALISTLALLLFSTKVVKGALNKDESFQKLPSFKYFLQGKSSHPELKAYIEDLKKIHADRGNVTGHMLTHSHDDVGWLKTVDEYYVGYDNDIAHASVECIITTVVIELLENPDRKFT
jgi:hypothetical protein